MLTAKIGETFGERLPRHNSPEENHNRYSLVLSVNICSDSLYAYLFKNLSLCFTNNEQTVCIAWIIFYLKYFALKRLWESYGVIVKISTVPLDSKEDCKQIIEESSQMGHIAAIFNLAVVLDDAIFENQTPKSFVTSFVPKAFATEYLDEITRQTCPELR